MSFVTRLLPRVVLSVFFTAALICHAPTPAQAQSKSARAPIQYYRMTPQGIIDTLIQTPGRKVLYIYAASSPASQQSFPEMLELADMLHREKIATFIGVSLDANVKELDRLLNIYARIPFLPIVAVRNNPREFIQAFEAIGVRYSNSMPFVVAMDESNNVLLHGPLSAIEIREVIIPREKIRKKRTSVYDNEIIEDTEESVPAGQAQ